MDDQIDHDFCLEVV